MSIVGSSCLVFIGGQFREAIIRASSQPLYDSSTLSQARVLLEWCDSDCLREWVDLANSDNFQAVYIEKELLWARRVLPSEQQRAVAWPARAFVQLFNSVPQPPDTLVVEYFCDKERTHLFFNETKPLILSDAKATLSQHPQMLQELAQWEEAAVIKEMLANSSAQLTGCHVNVCNVQQPQNWISGVVTYHNMQTKELTVVDDCTGTTHTVNPLMVHVVVSSPSDEGVQGGWQSHSQLPPLSLTSSPADIPPSSGSPANINSPLLTSPIIQECPSPQFPSPSPMGGAVYPGAGHRRLSLQQSMSMMRSEPNIHRRCSLDPLTLKKLMGPFEMHPNSSNQGQSQSLGRLPLHSTSSNPSHLRSSPHGSNSHLSTHGSNSSLNDQIFPTFTPPEDPMEQQGRSKSLGNIFSSLSSAQQLSGPHHQQPPPTQAQHAQNSPPVQLHQQQVAPQQQQQQVIPPQVGGPPSTTSATVASGGGGGVAGSATSNAMKRRASYGFNNLARGAIKRPRFEVLPTILDPQAEHTAASGAAAGGDATGDLRSTLPYTIKSLSRSASQPVVFPRKHLERRLNKLNAGRQHGSAGGGATGDAGGEGGSGSVGGRLRHEDDLDIIKQIIEKDETLHDTADQVRQGGIHFRSQSLSHIPGEFSSVSSLPTLHHAESMHLLHSNYFSAPDFSQLGSPPSFTLKHGVGGGSSGDITGGDASYHQLTHESRSSSLGDCHTSLGSVTNQQQPTPQQLQQQVNEFVLDSGARRGSNFDAQIVTSAAAVYNGSGSSHQSGPLSLSHPNDGFGASTHVSMYDFTRHRDSVQSLSYSESDSSTHTPSGYELGRRESGVSDNISAASGSISFQFPALSRSSNPLSFSTSSASQDSSSPLLETGPVSSSLPLREYLTSQTSTPLATGSLQFDRKSGSRVENPLLISGSSGFTGVLSNNKDGTPVEPPNIVPEAEILSVGADDEDNFENDDDLGEFSISRIINQHAAGDDMGSFNSSLEDGLSSPTASHPSSSSGAPGEKSKRTKLKSGQQLAKDKSNHPRRSRGRPRLTEEEKQRRKELRDLGLMKRSKRRTKEQVAEWRKQKILTPAKRGRKPGSGKKNIIKAATGKVVYVSVDISRYANGTVLLQNGFCRAFPGVSKCLDCGTAEDDLPASRYCRFLEFRKLRVVDNSQPLIDVEGFADFSDVNTEDIVPWTPLRAGFGRMDEQAAMFILKKVISHFIAIVTEQAKTLPDDNVLPIWKRAVQGIRELCDTCATSIFNFHWLCRDCGFCICPACYHLACDSENGVEAVSSMTTAAWPPCVCNNQPHKPSGLILAQIIPANVFGNVVMQLLQVCNGNKIQVNAPRVIQRLVNALSQQEPQSKFDNDAGGGKRSKTFSPVKKTLTSQQLPPQLITQDMTYPPQHGPSISSSAFHSLDDLSSLELPHSCSNGGQEDQLESLLISAPHLWLCDGSLLYLLEPRHQDNLVAFQERWKRGQVVVVSGVHHYLDKELWTPQAFERDFGEEVADLVDCRLGMALLQLPSKTFWAGFDNMSLRLIDPSTDEPRLLKLKDWPTCDDFSEKLPKRYEDLSNALPLPDYTRRDGKYNMAASLPSFFVKPDLGPKMYNAYGSPSHPSSGTTNLHLDISSAVNVMVHCSIPPSVAERERKLIEETVAAECCPETVRRIRESGAQVGAIWHIYPASDADKLRAFLRKVYEERGLRPISGTDPIHDQLLYLDFDLRQRLYQEYGVKGWAIAQCVGDAIFIPAGAPHQVRNVCSCIKVAEDFVAPEQISECLKLTEEFRQLSDRHANHEDKLQVKNIIFHSMKDIVGLLKSTVK